MASIRAVFLNSLFDKATIGKFLLYVNKKHDSQEESEQSIQMVGTFKKIAFRLSGKGECYKWPARVERRKLKISSCNSWMLPEKQSSHNGD